MSDNTEKETLHPYNGPGCMDCGAQGVPLTKAARVCVGGCKQPRFPECESCGERSYTCECLAN